MSARSHKYEIEAGGRLYKGELQMNEGQTFANTDLTDSPSSTLRPSSTLIAAVNTLMTAVKTCATTLGKFSSLHITAFDQSDKGKVAQ